MLFVSVWLSPGLSTLAAALVRGVVLVVIVVNIVADTFHSISIVSLIFFKFKFRVLACQPFETNKSSPV